MIYVYTSAILCRNKAYLGYAESALGKSEKTKKQRKDSQLIIRIAKDDRDAFVDLCDTLDTSAAREIRRFIRDFLKDHESATAKAETHD
jgi:hypothetical protein